MVLGQCCEIYGINESSVRARAWRTHCTWEDAVKHFIEKSSVNKLKKIFVYKEACELTGLSEKTMRTLMKNNTFMVRIGRRTLIDKKKFQKWIDRQS